MATKNIRIDFSGLSYTDSSTFTVSDNTGVSFTGITKAQLTAGYPFEASNTATEVVVRCTGGTVCLNTEASGAITPEATVTPTPTVTTAPPTDTPTPTPEVVTNTPTPEVTTAPPTDTPTPTPDSTPVPDTYYRFTNCVTSAFVFQTNGINTEPGINSRWTDGFENYIYGGVSTTLPGSPIVTNLTGPIGTDCYDEATNTPTPAVGTCQFVFVEDTVDTTNKGLQYNFGGEVKTPFPMLGTSTNIGGTDGVVYGICTTGTISWWDVPSNTFTPLPAGVSLLASGGPCQANEGCEYQIPTPTPTTPVTDTPTPTPQTTYYIFDACDGGETILATLGSAPLDARLRYVDYSQTPNKYFVYTGNTTTSAAGFTVNSNLQSTGFDQYECLSDTATPTPVPPPQAKYTTSSSPSVSISSNGSDDSTFTITVTETVNLKGTMSCNTGTGTGTLTLNVPGQGNVTTGPIQYSGFGSNDTGTITLSPGTYTNSTLTLTGSGAQGQLVLTGNIFEA